MSEEPALFGESATPEQPSRGPIVHYAADWQVDRIRRSLDQLQMATMDARKACIEEVTARPVESLRDLTFREAQTILEVLAERSSGSTRGLESGTMWDNREGDTWIDRL